MDMLALSIAVFMAFIQAVYIFLFVFLIASKIRSYHHDPIFCGCAAIAILGSASFLLLVLDYVSLPNVFVQKLFTIGAIIALSATAMDVIRRRHWRNALATPTLICLACTLLLIILTYAPLGTADPLNTVVSRWVKWLPMDNQLPFFGAQALSSGTVAVGYQAPHMGDWLYSDRPPLQTALFMLTPGYLLPDPDPWAYVTAGVSLQVLSLFGVWLMVNSMAQSRGVANVAAVTCFLSPITIENGAYVWPKLIAASFTLSLAALLFSERRDDGTTPTQRGMVMGALASLAMLSHAGTAFAIMGIGTAAVLTGRLPPWRQSAVATLTGISLYTPWLIYQRVINPPGNRLIKWYLSNVTVVDPRSLWQSLVDVYGKMTVDQAVMVRWINFRQVFQHYLAVIADTLWLIEAAVLRDGSRFHDLLLYIRETEFYYVVAGTGLLGIFLVLTPIISALSDQLRPLAVSIMATLIIWVVLMFQPGAATIHQGAYFLELAVVALACMTLAKISWRLLLGAATLHGCVSIIQFAS